MEQKNTGDRTQKVGKKDVQYLNILFLNRTNATCVDLHELHRLYLKFGKLSCVFLSFDLLPVTTGAAEPETSDE